MDKEKYLIAVASSDGIVVNNHFGKARTFYIYEAEDEKVQFVEIRKVEPICNGGNHVDKELSKKIVVFSDCKFLLVSRIGREAWIVAESYGIEAYEIPGEIMKSIEQLIKYKKVKELFQ